MIEELKDDGNAKIKDPNLNYMMKQINKEIKWKERNEQPLK